MFKKLVIGLHGIFLAALISIAPAYAAEPIEVAITVDDLPLTSLQPPNMSRMQIAETMLDALDKHHLKGVYGFINGVAAANRQREGFQILQKWMGRGQLLANHTYTHTDLAHATPQEYIKDIQKNEPMLQELMKDKNYKYFRYPFLAEGNTLEKRNAIRNFLTKNNYTIAPVTIDFFDYEWNNPYGRCVKRNDQQSIEWLQQSYVERAVNALTVAQELSQLLFKRQIKHILLIHIGAMDALALDKLLTAYEQKGVKFISLGEALSDEAYKMDPKTTTRWAWTFLNQVRIVRNVKNPPVVAELYATSPSKKLKAMCKG